MSDVSLYDFASEVRVLCPGCPLPVIKDALRTACRQFLQQSEVWVEELTAINIVAEQSEYSVTAPTGNVLLRLVGASSDASIDDYPLDLSAISFDRATPSVTLAAEPQAALTNVLVLKFALGLTRDASDIPDWIADRWGDGIRSGALSILHRQIGFPWARPELVQSEASDFKAAVNDAMMSRVTADNAADAVMQVPEIL